MRLPWPFGRAQRSPSSSGDGAATASASGGATAPPPARASGDAWRGLPPLAETVGPPPLVAPNRPFAAALAGNEAPAPILKPLSHGRSLEAPAGIVSGIARPTATVAGPSLPAPVQRSPLGRRSSTALEPVDWSQDSDAAEAPHAATAASAASVDPTPEPTSAAPIRRLEPVTAAPSRPMLTRAAEPAGPAALVGLVGQPAVARAAGVPMGPTAAPGVQRSPATVPEPGSTATAPAAIRDSAGVAAAPITARPRLTIGQARRLGLGAPIAGGPVADAAPAFRTATASATDAPARAAMPLPPTGAGVQRAPVESVAPVEPPPPGGDAPEIAGDGADPAMPVTTSAAVQRAPLRDPAMARPLAPQPETPAVGAAAPIVSARPLRSGVQRAPLTLPQRAAEEAGTGSTVLPAGAPTAATGSSGPVTIRRDSQASQLSTALDARSFTHGGEIFLPASHGPLTSGKGKALLAHEMTHVAQQRRLGSGLPTESSSHGKTLEAEAVAAERSSELTLATPPPGPTETAPSPRPHDAGAVGTTATSGAPGAQRAPQEGGGSNQRAGSGRGAQRPSRHTHTEQELEVLAHQLYHRIGRHLRRELLVDRERVGFALDLP